MSRPLEDSQLFIRSASWRLRHAISVDISSSRSKTSADFAVYCASWQSCDSYRLSSRAAAVTPMRSASFRASPRNSGEGFYWRCLPVVFEIGYWYWNGSLRVQHQTCRVPGDWEFKARVSGFRQHCDSVVLAALSTTPWTACRCPT